MKKKALLGIAMSAMLGVTAFAGGSALGAFAATGGGEVSPNAGDLIQWESETTWVDEGLQLEMGQWESGAFRMFFDVSNGKAFTMKFKVPVYEKGTSNFRHDGDKMISKYICDVFVEDYTSGGSRAKTVLRLWGDSNGAGNANSISARITAGDLHNSDVYTPEKNPTEVANNIWIKGAMTDKDEFEIKFDTTETFSGHWGTWDSIDPLLTVSGDVPNGAQVKQTIHEQFQNSEAVQVYFRLSAQHSDAYDDNETNCPEHAANATGRIIVTEVNGQSLANTNGTLNDTVAPYLAPVKIKPNTEITMGKEYSLDVKNAPTESAAQPLYCDYVSDVLGYSSDLKGHGHFTYSAEITALSGAAKTVDVDKIVFDEVGENKIKVTVTDEGGNSYTTPETTVTVVKGFLLTVTGVPETGTVGTKITLPAGSATDSKDNACTVTISVEDPYTKKYDVTDNSFTPDKAGAWIVTYSSQNEDGTEHDSKQFRIAVATAPAGDKEEGGGKKGCGGTIAGIGAVAVTAIGAGIAATVIRKKRK